MEGICGMTHSATAILVYDMVQEELACERASSVANRSANACEGSNALGVAEGS